MTTSNEINIGDQVYFEHIHLNNYGLYWTVISINSDDSINISVNEMGVKDKLTIEASCIRVHLKINL